MFYLPWNVVYCSYFRILKEKRETNNFCSLDTCMRTKIYKPLQSGLSAKKYSNIEKILLLKFTFTKQMYLLFWYILAPPVWFGVLWQGKKSTKQKFLKVCPFKNIYYKGYVMHLLIVWAGGYVINRYLSFSVLKLHLKFVQFVKLFCYQYLFMSNTSSN